MEKVINLGKEGEEKIIMLQKESIVLGGAVNSVNGQTGDVVLTTSDLENTSDYQTSDEVESAISSAIADKQDTLTAGANITIENNTISAIDTTYSNFVGTDGTTAGMTGLVPAPANTDVDKFLKSDGTWDIAGGGGGPTVVQATGDSTTDVMSQNATTSMVFADPGTNKKVVIGDGAAVSAQNYNLAIGGNAKGNGASATAVGYNARAQLNSVAIGYDTQAGTSASHTQTIAIGMSAYVGGMHGVGVGPSSNCLNNYSTAIGSSARARSERSVAIGASAQVENNPAMAYSVALGANAQATRAGEVNIGTGANNFGYNNTPYRVIGGVHDGQLANDAVTVGQINAVIDDINAALGSSISHIGS